MIVIQMPAWIDAFPPAYVTIRFGDHMHMPHECRMSLSGKIYLWLILVMGTTFPAYAALVCWIGRGEPFVGVVLALVMAVFYLCVFKYCLFPYCSYVCIMPECVVFRRYIDGKEFVLKPGTTFYFKTLRAVESEGNAIVDRIYGEDRGLAINIDDKIWLFFVEGFMINGPEFRKRIEETLSGFRNPAL